MNHEIRTAIFRVLPFVIVLLVIFLRVKQQKLNPPDLGLNKPVSVTRFVLWIFGFLFLVLLIEFSLYQFGLLEVDRWDHPLVSSIIRILGAIIIGPVAEELIFRGLLLNVLTKKKLTIHLAIFVQAVFFVLLHSFTYENTLSSNIGIVQSFIDATLFGYARYSTKSIYTSMTMHMTGNLVATVERFIF
ncbi:MAG: hypothetical protein JWP12_1046 [Bacteroidetes bacterium]|nr:hypothetical protein [Bacteroidota bacterium]